MSAKDFFFHHSRWQYERERRYDQQYNKTLKAIQGVLGKFVTIELVDDTTQRESSTRLLEGEYRFSDANDADNIPEDVIIPPYGTDKQAVIDELRLPRT